MLLIIFIFLLYCLNNIIKSIPIEYSKPAKPSKKIDNVIKFISLFIDPYNNVKQYNNIHINSEYNNNLKKFDKLLITNKILIQTNNDQKFNQFCNEYI